MTIMHAVMTVAMKTLCHFLPVATVLGSGGILWSPAPYGWCPDRRGAGAPSPVQDRSNRLAPSAGRDRIALSSSSDERKLLPCQHAVRPEYQPQTLCPVKEGTSQCDESSVSTAGGLAPNS